jgi:hypothetical protein
MMRNPFPACGRHRARWSLRSPHDAASPKPPGKAVVVVAVLASSTACGSLLQWAAVPPPRRQSSSPAEASVAGVPPERSTPTGSATPSASTMGSPSPVPALLRAIEAPERSEHRLAVQAQSPQSNSKTIAYLGRCDLLTRLTASRRATLSRKGRGCTVVAARSLTSRRSIPSAAETPGLAS